MASCIWSMSACPFNTAPFPLSMPLPQAEMNCSGERSESEDSDSDSCSLYSGLCSDSEWEWIEDGLGSLVTVNRVTRVNKTVTSTGTHSISILWIYNASAGGKRHQSTVCSILGTRWAICDASSISREVHLVPEISYLHFQDGGQRPSWI